MSRILDEEFNAVVLKMVKRVCPEGYLLSSEQTQSFEQMCADYRRNGKLTINTGFSENTIFGSPEVNWAFRAWHDRCHLNENADFSPEGERRAAYAQQRQLAFWFEGHPKLAFWLALVDVEVNGQVEYYEKHGGFPVNQYDFTVQEIEEERVSCQNLEVRQ